MGEQEEGLARENQRTFVTGLGDEPDTALAGVSPENLFEPFDDVGRFSGVHRSGIDRELDVNARHVYLPLVIALSETGESIEMTTAAARH
ncbi:hypothetical protein ACFYY8_16160 [Streptosporangium sp. NPDC001559]|uniref:hypothetical protein n=1 Tax=Streptosporangium sp. NPDC001559 TaxID=3366187 RepID=UPI0036E566EB